MFNRQKYFASYQMQFVKDYKKALEGFSEDEQIHLIDTLLEIIGYYKEKDIDYPKIQHANDELYKKYRKRLTNYSNLTLSEYFNEESTKHLDLQFDLKMEGAGESDNFFTDTEQKYFLARTEIYLKNDKRMRYLQSEPKEDNKEAELGETKIKASKGKHKQRDTISKLNQEQTALLIHYLQKGGLIRKETSLNNTEAGEVFEMLTGYSANTLRQSLSKDGLKAISSKKNLTVLANALTQTNNLIDIGIKMVKDSA